MNKVRIQLKSHVYHLVRLWLLLAVAGFAAPAAADDFEARLPVKAGGELRVELTTGSVEIERHDELTVRVEARIGGWRPGSSTFTVTPKDGNVRIRGSAGGFLGGLGRASRLHVRVPAQYSVDIRTNGGSVTVEELRGSVKVRTRGARIEVGQIEGSVELYTSGARIDVQEIVGNVKVRTTGARIEIDEVTGAVDAETSGARIEAKDVGGPVRLRTSSGTISARFTGPPAGKIETSGGSIEIEIPEAAGANIDARTTGGRVELDEDFPFNGSRSRDRVKGKIGGGGKRLTVHTSGGNIRIEMD